MENKLPADVQKKVDEVAQKYESATPHEGLGPAIFKDGVDYAFACAMIIAAQQKDKGPQGAVWVKANTPGIKDGHYVAKYKPDDIQYQYDPVGMAFIDTDYVRFVCPSVYDIKWAKGHEELKYLQILDESATPNTDYQQLKEKAEKMEKALKNAKDFIEWVGENTKPIDQRLFESLSNDYNNTIVAISEALNDQPKLTPEQIADRKEAIEWYRNPGNDQPKGKGG